MNSRIENWNDHEIRFIEVSPGDWWAVAKDVSVAMGYSKTENMTKRIKPKYKGTAKWNTLGGDQEVVVLSEQGTYKAIMNSHKPDAESFQDWVFDVLRELRQSSGLEGFQVFRMLDKQHQVEAMNRLRDGLQNPVRVDFIKANTIANKAISTLYGHPKMLKKEQMTPDMLVRRQPVLTDTVNLMAANEAFDLCLSVSKAVYSKYSGKAD